MGKCPDNVKGVKQLLMRGRRRKHLRVVGNIDTLGVINDKHLDILCLCEQ